MVDVKKKGTNLGENCKCHLETESMDVLILVMEQHDAEKATKNILTHL